MAFAFLGETTLRLGSEKFTLRPSFDALHEIEIYANAAIPQIIDALEHTSDVEFIQTIIGYGLFSHYHDMPDLPLLERDDWLNLRGVAQEFLLRGMGLQLRESKSEQPASRQVLKGVPTQTRQEESAASNHSNTNSAPPAIEPLNWPILYQTATALLGKSEVEFWQMTLCGMMLQSEAYANAQGFEMSDIGTPATLEDLNALMAQFPDAAPAH